MAWSLPAYEQLMVQWQMTADQASGVLTWLLDLIVRSIESGDAPPVR